MQKNNINKLKSENKPVSPIELYKSAKWYKEKEHAQNNIYTSF